MGSVRETLEEQRRRARERVAALERDLAGLAEAASAAGTDDEHDPEGATIAFERARVGALLDQARGHLSDIDAAVRRIDEGRYDVCERCGGRIGAERLAARAVARTCITCARAR